MHSETIRYNRNTLYEQVWTVPMLKLAKSYGLSDVGLRKICRRLRVPCPTRGYWGRGRAGRADTPPRLPALRQGEREEIVEQRAVKLPVDPGQSSEADTRIAFEKAPENAIHVAEVLTDPHPLVERTRRSLHSAGRSQSGWLQPRSAGCLDLRVTRESLDRALRILDALIKAMAARGFPVSIGSGEKHPTQVLVLGETLEFHLEEKLTRSVRELTKRELREKERSPWLHNTPQHVYSASSDLELCIDAHFASGLRRRWRDSQQHRLEESLNKFAIGLLRGAVEQRAERLERERQHQEYLEQQRRAEEERQRQVAAKRRVEILDHCLASWHKCKEIRAFLAARFPPGSTAGAAETQDPELQRWLDWANRYAAHLEKCAGSFPEYEAPPRGW